MKLMLNAFNNFTIEAQDAHDLMTKFCLSMLCLLPQSKAYK